MVAFTLDTIEMNTGLRDTNGSTWYITDTQGWFDAPDMRQTIIDRSLGHGSIMAASVMDKRRVQLSGICKATGSESNVWRSRDRLIAALTTFTAGRYITVNEYGLSKQCLYWGASGTQITIIPGGFTFAITLVCEDARKFSPVTTTLPQILSGASQNVMVFGSFQTPPIITVNNLASGAATSALRVTNTFGGSVIGTVYVYAYQAAAGETKLVIDVMNRTVQGMSASGGSIVNRYGSLNPYNLSWFDLQPGANNVLALAGSSSNMQLSYKDAWL